MKQLLLSTLAALALLSTGAAFADDLDVSMQVLDSPRSVPISVTKTLVLPPTATGTARERSQLGHDTANSARELGRDFGKARAETAKANAPANPQVNRPITPPGPGGGNPGGGPGNNPGQGNPRP